MLKFANDHDDLGKKNVDTISASSLFLHANYALSTDLVTMVTVLCVSFSVHIQCIQYFWNVSKLMLNVTLY